MFPRDRAYAHDGSQACDTLITSFLFSLLKLTIFLYISQALWLYNFNLLNAYMKMTRHPV